MAVKEKIRIRIKGYDHQLVDQAAGKIVETARRTGARVSGPVPLPTEKEVVTILRAVHKYKDAREQFETRTHKRLIDILRPSNKTVEALQGLELPAGVDIEIKLYSSDVYEDEESYFGHQGRYDPDVQGRRHHDPRNRSSCRSLPRCSEEER